jgi:hypothetical protein
VLLVVVDVAALLLVDVTPPRNLSSRPMRDRVL